MTEVELEISPDLALRIMASRSCKSSTDGRCPDHFSPLAKYGADRMCDPCLARIALAYKEAK